MAISKSITKIAIWLFSRKGVPVGFGEELKRLREEKGLTQKQLAEILSVKQPVVAKFEKSTGVHASTLFALAAALGVDANHFRPFLAEEPPAKPKGKRRK